jgi:hypothetical protein
MTLTVPSGQVPNLSGQSSSSGFHGASDFWTIAENQPPRDGFETRRAQVIFSPTASKPMLALSGKTAPHPVAWKPEEGIFTISGKNVQSIVGFVGGKSVSAGDLSVEFAPSTRNFASLTLTPTPSGSRLLTVMDKAENPGLEWDAGRRTAKKAWERGPVQVWGVAAQVSLVWREKTAQVWALDNTGKRRKRLSVQLSGGRLSFAISPSDRTIWYELSR